MISHTHQWGPWIKYLLQTFGPSQPSQKASLHVQGALGHLGEEQVEGIDAPKADTRGHEPEGLDPEEEELVAEVPVHQEDVHQDHR